jgi:O-antigen/teichoic acid export membrane protein
VFAVAYGVVGVVLANLAGSFVSTLCAAYFGVHRFKLQFEARPTLKIYLAGFLASLLPLLLLYFMSARYVEVLVIGAGLYLFVYVTLLPLLRVIDERELAALERMTRRIRGLSAAAKPVLRYVRKILSMRFRS